MDAILAHLNSKGLHRRYGCVIGRLYAIAEVAGGTRADVEALISADYIVTTGEADDRLCWSPEGWAEVTARAAAVEEAIATLARHGVKAYRMGWNIVVNEPQVGELNRVLRRLP